MLFFAITTNAFQEFIFPNTDNTDYHISLDRSVFHFKHSVKVNFEVINRRWSIMASEGRYEIIHHNKTVERVELKGNELITLKTNAGEVIKGFTFDSKLALVPFTKYLISGVNRICIGSEADNNIVYSFHSLVSKHHCQLVRNAGGFEVQDNSSNGTFINHCKAAANQILCYGDVINIFGLKIIYLGDIIAVSSSMGVFNASEGISVFEQPVRTAVTPHNRHRDIFFNRAPRMFPSIVYDDVVIDPPTALNQTKKKSVLLTIGPSFTMAIPMLLGVGMMILSSNLSGNGPASPFMYMGLITATGSAGLGAMWALLNLRASNKQEIEDETQRFNLYGNYLIDMSEYIKSLYLQNYNALHLMYPSAEECCRYNQHSKQLWTRNNKHNDYLFFRLGLGNMDFQVNIKIPTEKFSMVYDSLKDKPAILYDNFKVLRGVPVGVDLAQSNLYGIAGGKRKEGVYDIVNDLIIQIAASLSYTDAKIVFCFDSNNPEDQKRWEYIKWLPHVWSKDKGIRYYATNRQETSDILFELSNIIRQRADEFGSSYDKKVFSPHYFLFVSDIGLFEGELIGKYIFDRSEDYGLTTFIMTDSYHNLPNRCENIIQNDANFKGVFNVFRNTGEALAIDFDKVSEEELMRFAKRISGIVVKEVEDTSEIVSSLTFFEMYGVNSPEELNVSEQWRKNRTYNTMRSLIGKKSGGGDCYLDIHEKHHGPHGLIAGTTGSGKSETIQTFILSLAINYSPDDVEFFIIDFKGGGMANLFEKLPHLAGQISNLSGNQIRRAMVSIKSENLRRQKLFGEYGVNNINHYTQLYKNGKATVPIPHLLIIIDEFAELKKEEPDFMRELISVAQVGRSLGVHLILATQKPAGTVDDNIWSNAKFRICLRVQDRQDSNDMLHNSDAAFITQAGRGYLQVGNNELYEQFQSGWSGAVYEDGEVSDNSDIATMITATGRTALVGSHAKMKRKESEKRRWIGFLYNCVTELRENKDTGEEQAAAEIIRRARRAGYNIGESSADLSAVKNFISIVPQGSMKTEEAVSYINLFAAQSNIKLPELQEKTQLEAVVEYLRHIADEEGYHNKANLWMPLLRRRIALTELVDQSEICTDGVWCRVEPLTYSVVIGEYDDPHNQTQLPFSVNFSDGGHLAVCGSVVSGKSTLLQTLILSMALKYSPEDVNFYILDFSGGMLSSFSALPHTGGVILENDNEKIAKLFNMIGKMIVERKKLLNGGSFAQYIKATSNRLPALFVVIDNFAGFKEKTENAYEDILIRLAREGIAYGIYLVLSSAGFGMAEIQNRIGDNIKTVISLDMGDKFKFMDVLRTTHIDVLPEMGIKGRGIGFVDGRLLEFQTAVAVDTDDDYKRNSAVAAMCEKMAVAWTGDKARPIPDIPEDPTMDDLSALDEYQHLAQDPQAIPFAYRSEDASVYSVDLPHTFCYMITGKKRTGKTNVMKLLISSVVNKTGTKVIIEQNSAELKNYTVGSDFRYVSNDREIFDYFNELTPQFIERNRNKKELLEQGCSDEEIYAAMQKYEPVFIFIADFSDFLESIYHPSDSIQNMNGFFENIFEKGFLHNVFFFACVNTDDVSAVAGRKAYMLYTSYKMGVHLGGNLSAQRIFNFSNIHFSLMSKQMKKGEGLVPDADDDSIAVKVIVPYCGGKTI